MLRIALYNKTIECFLRLLRGLNYGWDPYCWLWLSLVLHCADDSFLRFGKLFGNLGLGKRCV